MAIDTAPPPGLSSGFETGYLSDLSPKDRPWDTHRLQAQNVAAAYRRSERQDFHDLAERVDGCSRLLEFGELVDPDTGELRFKLRTTHFCRVRHCPVCQWRRGLMWKARILSAMPKIDAAYPGHRWLLLTLTVPNCKPGQVRSKLSEMGKAWRRMVAFKGWPAVAHIRAIEVTRGKDGSAHPHYHVLLMVPGSYFGRGYVKQDQYLAWWRKAMKDESITQVDIRPVKPKAKSEECSGIHDAVSEVVKYAVKPGDMLGNDEWFFTITDQLYKLRFLEIGGCIKGFFKEEEPEDLVHGDEEKSEQNEGGLFFGWQWRDGRYVKVS
jgi:plasmid rolling circle replication initiator protein Rep